MRTSEYILVSLILMPFTICRGQYPAFAKTLGLPYSSAAFIPSAIVTSDSGMMFLVQHDSLKALVKLDVNGDLAWARQYPQVISDNFWSAISYFPTDDGGAVFVNEYWTDMIAWNSYARTIVGRIDAAGEMVWSKRVRAETYWGATSFSRLIPVTGNGMFITHVSSPGISNAQYITKMDWNGNLLWHRELMAPFGVQDLRAHATEDGGCVLVCWPGSWGDRILVSRFDTNGTLQWSRSVKMTNAAWDYSMGEAITTSTGDTYVTGSQNGPTPSQGFICKLSPAGALVWYKFQDAVGSTSPAPRDRVMELLNGILGFGPGHRRLIDTSGVNLPGTGYSAPSYTLLSNGYGLNAGWWNSPEEQNMVVGDWEVEDPVFGYIHHSPVVMRFPHDAAGSCFYDTSAYITGSDTLVPWAYLQVLDEGASTVRTWDVIDTTILSIPVPLTLGDFCPLLSVPSNGPDVSDITVYPTLAGIGEDIRMKGSGIRSVDLVDAMGRVIMHRDAFGQDRPRINTEGLCPGAYVVIARAHDGRPLASRRVILQ